MKLQVAFVQLPLRFDAARLAAEIAALGDVAWRPHPEGYPGNDALSLIARGGDPADDGVAGPMLPTPHLARLPYMRQVLASFRTVLGRTRLMRLSGHAEVSAHIDSNYYWHDRLRIHVPVVTQPTVRFFCGDAEVHMAAGECWIFDTWRRHRVANDAVESRIHLVADSVGSPAFWQVANQGRAPDRPQPAWQPREVAYDPALDPALTFETTNVPKVMTPWELRAHVDFLCGEAVPGADLRPLIAATNRLMVRWRSNWSAHGDADAGRDEYTAALADYGLELQERVPPIALRNGLDLVKTLRNLVMVPALGGRQKPPAERGEVPIEALAAEARR
jgi:hypothetical protein